MTARSLPGALPDDPGPHRALADAIRHHAERGQLPRCHGSDWPISEDDDLRALVAAEWCPRCPVQAECLAAGLSESFGVWGGRHADPRTRTPRRTRKENRS